MAKERPLPAAVPPEGAARASEEGAKPPPHGTPKPLTERDVAGELPRVCHELDRVPAGSKARRFKCRVSNYPDHARPKYVLALDKETAKACHLKACGVESHLQLLKDNGAAEKDLPAPVVVVTELPD